MSIIRVSRRSVEVFAPGDLTVLVAFVLIGEFSHGIMPWVYPVMVVETAMTFLVGWIFVAPLVMGYQEANVASPFSAVGTALGGWIGATVVANALRATTVFHGTASVSFALVAAGFGGAMMAVWRYLRVRTTGV